MKAIVYCGPGQVELRDVAAADGDGVLIDVEACGICGTDLTIYKGAQPFEQRCCSTQIVSLPRQQTEIDQVAECVGQGHDLGRHAAARASDGLALSPPFAPCPWRWTLTIVPSIMAYSKSVSSAKALNIL